MRRGVIVLDRPADSVSEAEIEAYSGHPVEVQPNNG